MSIITKTGDDGTTALMYGRRVPKHHPQVVAYGSVDELTSALGLARATASAAIIRERLPAVQNELIMLMGELATAPEDLSRYIADGFSRVAETMVARLEDWTKNVEAKLPPAKGWAIPGGTPGAAALDLARSICRRAERDVCALRQVQPAVNPQIIMYLNRLADFLWVLARWIEAQELKSPGDTMLV